MEELIHLSGLTTQLEGYAQNTPWDGRSFVPDIDVVQQRSNQ